MPQWCRTTTRWETSEHWWHWHLTAASAHRLLCVPDKFTCQPQPRSCLASLYRGPGLPPSIHNALPISARICEVRNKDDDHGRRHITCTVWKVAPCYFPNGAGATSTANCSDLGPRFSPGWSSAKGSAGPQMLKQFYIAISNCGPI